MSLRFLLSVLFILGFLFLEAQDLPKYTVDLDNEMHYKINATNWQERGVKEFKEDVQVSLKHLDLKVKWINVFFELNFDNTGKPSLGLFGTSDTFAEDVLEIEIKKCILELIKNFKPARYNGDVIPEKYLIQFSINFNNNMLAFYNVEFEPTINFDNLKTGVDCFTIYSTSTGNAIPEAIFLASEIEPEYKGGMNFLCFNLNRQLVAKYDTKISRKAINSDSIDVHFIINKAGKLGVLAISQSSTEIDIEILDIIKTTSCDWRPAIISGRPLNFALRLRFVYEYIVEKENQTKKLVKISKIKRERALQSDFNDLRN